MKDYHTKSLRASIDPARPASLSNHPAPRRGLPAATHPRPPSIAKPVPLSQPPKPDVARAAQNRLGWPRTAPSAHLRYRLTRPAAPRASICPTRRTRLIAKRPSRPGICIHTPPTRVSLPNMAMMTRDCNSLQTSIGDLRDSIVLRRFFLGV